jgi:hypothetical protein
MHVVVVSCYISRPGVLCYLSKPAQEQDYLLRISPLREQSTTLPRYDDTTLPRSHATAWTFAVVTDLHSRLHLHRTAPPPTSKQSKPSRAPRHRDIETSRHRDTRHETSRHETRDTAGSDASAGIPAPAPAPQPPPTQLKLANATQTHVTPRDGDGGWWMVDGGWRWPWPARGDFERERRCVGHARGDGDGGRPQAGPACT